jgi:hypothetical protein
VEKLAQATDEIGRGAAAEADLDVTRLEADQMDVRDELPVEDRLPLLACQLDGLGKARQRRR